MDNNKQILYETYPFLMDINIKSKGVFDEKLIGVKLKSNEFIKTGEEKVCAGVPFVIKGELKIQRINEDGDETSLYTIKRGELCHEALGCFMNCLPLNIEAYALYDSDIFIVPAEVVKLFLFNDIDFIKFLYKDLYSKFNRIIDKNEDIIHESLDSRLMNFLNGKNSKNIYITHKEIAKEIGSSREVISRKLKRLEKEGVLTLSRGKITMNE
ncbi:Crp/Fnr family transcriptional regulator [Clostridium sp.]|uniref:Crp/Fnr family transcriptional regulator n=1 Tax=Clostridium sp. TaxID=1506 RepID=UPI002629F325|nr:Crp/Fnr family transcriptional regulator [Clostridium sp.]